MLETARVFKHFASLFNLTCQVEFKPQKPDSESSYEILFLETENKAVVKGRFPDLKKDMAEICASIKLAEKHPLLCTFYFQKDADKDPKIASYCRSFVELCSPLKDAWVWRIIKEHLPEKEFEKELDELVRLHRAIESSLPFFDEHTKRRLQIGAYIVLYALGQNVEFEFKFTGKSEYRDEWMRYLKALEEFALKEPDPVLFTKLPERTNAPYRVNIESKPYLHYEIRGVQ